MHDVRKVHARPQIASTLAIPPCRRTWRARGARAQRVSASRGHLDPFFSSPFSSHARCLGLQAGLCVDAWTRATGNLTLPQTLGRAGYFTAAIGKVRRRAIVTPRHAVSRRNAMSRGLLHSGDRQVATPRDAASRANIRAIREAW